MKKALLVMRYFLPDSFKNDAKTSIHPKFDCQINALTKLGYQCTFIGIDGKGNIYKICNEKERLGKIRLYCLPLIRQYFGYKCLYRHAAKISKKEKFDLVYVRNCPNTFNYPKMMKVLRTNCDNVVVEIPTYPSNQEVAHEKRLWIRLIHPFVNFIEKQSSKYVRLYALIGESSSSFRGQPAINIINGTNVDGKKEHTKKTIDSDIHMIALAEMAHYHGYDRIIEGLKLYYEKKPKVNFYFHMVGTDVDGSLSKWMKMAKDYGLSKYVFSEGFMKGKTLDDFFDRCDIACGSMGGFRRGTHFAFDLKNAEYLSRGIPFVCCKFEGSDRKSVV